MKSVSLKDELAIHNSTRGLVIKKPFTVEGNHYSTLKAAINAAKNKNSSTIHITKTKTAARCKTVATVLQRESGFFEVVIW